MTLFIQFVRIFCTLSFRERIHLGSFLNQVNSRNSSAFTNAAARNLSSPLLPKFKSYYSCNTVDSRRVLLGQRASRRDALKPMLISVYRQIWLKLGSQFASLLGFGTSTIVLLFFFRFSRGSRVLSFCEEIFLILK